MADYKKRPANVQAYDRVARYLADLDGALANGEGLLLWGPAQEGKTMLASIVLAETLRVFAAMSVQDQLLARRRMGRQDELGFPGYFIPLAEYVRAHVRMFVLEKRWSRLSDVDSSEEYAEYVDLDKHLEALRERVHLLVVDDVGKEHRTASKFAEDEFDFLLRHRHHHRLPTILTSNLAPKEWSCYNSSMPDFIARNFEVVEIRVSAQRRRTAVEE